MKNWSRPNLLFLWVGAGIAVLLFANGINIGWGLLVIVAAITWTVRSARASERARLQSGRNRVAMNEYRATGRVSGPYILFLRPFDHDFDPLFAVTDPKRQLGALLTGAAWQLKPKHECISVQGPDVAFGPSALRASDDDWQKLVLGLANEAHAIVLVPGASAAVQWETEVIIKSHLHKTAFVLQSFELMQEAFGWGDAWIAWGKTKDHLQKFGVELVRPPEHSLAFTLDPSTHDITRWPLLDEMGDLRALLQHLISKKAVA